MQENNREISIIKERIIQYLDLKGISKYECYQKSGIANGVLSQKGGISEENTLKFLSYFGDISADWLFTGKGSMLRNQNVQDSPRTHSNNTVQTVQNQHKDTKSILPVQEKDKIIPMTADERIDALIRQNDALSETNLALTKALQDAVKMAHETIAANQRQGETNQEIMKQLLSILENTKKNSHAGGAQDVPARRAAHG